jgi:hypothetical protein
LSNPIYRETPHPFTKFSGVVLFFKKQKLFLKARFEEQNIIPKLPFSEYNTYCAAAQ